MCLIVFKPKDVENGFTFEMFKDAAEINSDSVGIMYIKNGKMKVKKYLHPLKHLRSIYNKIKDKGQYAIHFRFATHGELNLNNAHPFEIVPGLWMMHNGILKDYGNTANGWSDTKDFAINYIRPIIQEKGIGILKNADFQQELSKKIGCGNKLLFIDKNFDVTIINEHIGTWYDGMWFSNMRTIIHYDYNKNAEYSNFLYYNNANKYAENPSYDYDMPPNCDEFGIPYFDDYNNSHDYWDTYQ